MNQSNQKGFSFVDVLVIIIILAGVAGAGWYALATLLGKTKHPSTSSNSQSNQKNQKTTDPSEGGKYLVIKEWGVRFVLPQKLQKDAYYDYVASSSANDQGTGIESIKLRSKKLDRITSTCGGAIFYMYGGISRSQTKLTLDEYSYAQPELNFLNLNDHWYHTFATDNEAAATYACKDRDRVSQEKDDLRISIGGAQAVYDSFRKLEPIEK